MFRGSWQDKKVKNSALFAKREQLEKSLPYPDEKEAKLQQERLKNKRDQLLTAEKKANERFLLLSEEEREKRGPAYFIKRKHTRTFQSTGGHRKGLPLVVFKAGFF